LRSLSQRLAGRLVGINALILSHSGGSMGSGIAQTCAVAGLVVTSSSMTEP